MSNTATSLDMRALLRRFMNNVERSSSKDLVLQIAIAAGSVFILAKLLRALAHYVFPSIIPGETNTVLLASPRPRIGDNPTTAKDLDNVKEYDYIIVGTGTAGAVIAARLTEDPTVSVLAIEAGHSDLKQLFSRVPAAFANLYASAADHDIRTEPEPQCNNRRMQWPRGKMLGGCSAINAMIFNKGAPDDYDEWERLGNPGWGFKDMEPYMRKAECFTQNPSAPLSADELRQHGRDGPWQIGYTSYSAPISETFVDACAAVGFDKVRDVNSRDGINGVSRCQTFIDRHGQRSSTAVAYLTPAVAARPNLHIAVGQTVTRIIFSSPSSPSARPRAVGVEMRASSVTPLAYLAKARREVVVCAGAVHTPHILKLSGVGPAAELAAHGVPLVADLPAVGANLADHLFCTLVAKVSPGTSAQVLADPVRSLPALAQWLRSGTGMMTTQVAEAAGFCRTAARADAPASLRDKDLSSGATSADLELLVGSAVFIDHGNDKSAPPGDYASLGPIMLRPESRGTVTLASADPFTPPRVAANYLSTQHDVDMLTYGLRLARSLVHTRPFAPHFKGWHWPAPRPASASASASAALTAGQTVDDMTDAQLEAHVRATTETIYHPMCSARMGPSPRNAAVDAQLRVHGVDGLRVADASVFPAPVACHPCAPVVFVGEHAADLLKGGVHG